jgi:DNA ligase (NAD+)
VTVKVGALAGETVVVTGVVEGLKRWEVDSVIVEAGGIAGDHVTQDTTLLVVGERPGATKQNKARDLGVATITEAEFRERIRS